MRVLLSTFVALFPWSILLATPTLSIPPEINALPGESTVVPVFLKGGVDDPDIATLQFQLEYSTNRLSISDRSAVRSGDLLTEHDVIVVLSPGTAGIVITPGDVCNLQSSWRDGTPMSVVLVTVEVDPSAGDEAPIEVKLSAVSAYDVEGNPVEIAAQSGHLAISDNTNVPFERQNEVYYPQVGNGHFSQLSFHVLLVFSNPHEAPVGARVDFFASGQIPMELSFDSGETGGALDFQIPPGGTRVFRSDGQGDLQVGYARVISTAPLVGGIYFQITGLGGGSLTETATESLPTTALSRQYHLPVQFRRGVYDTGIALVNIYDQPLEIEFSLSDEQGTPLETVTIELLDWEHRAEFASGLFESLSGSEEANAFLTITSPRPLPGILIKQEGLVLTAMQLKAD